jgi:hypothetical protein
MYPHGWRAAERVASATKNAARRSGAVSSLRRQELCERHPTGSSHVFLRERQPEFLLVLDEAGQLGAVERLEFGTGLLKPLL